MSKQYLKLLAFATLLCMMLFGAVSCKKEDTLDPNNADFFIDVDFLPESETNGEAAPRLMVNFNDEAVMIELRRPSASTPMESVLFLFPDNKATMMCGNDTLMICTAYDMETYTPSHDVLLVTPMDDNALLLTKGFMDWNTNTMTKGDQMVLTIDGTNKKQARKGRDDGDMRWFFYNRFIKPLTENLEQLDNFFTVLDIPQGVVIPIMKTLISTTAPIILFSDDPEEFVDAMEYSITSYAESAVQIGLLHFVPQDVSDMASRVLAAIGWFSNGGHGTVNENTEGDDFPISTFFGQGQTVTQASSQLGFLDPVFIVSLNVSNVTETTARLVGSYRLGSNSNMMPVEMGYIYKVNGGSGHTEYDLYFNGITISGLQKATKYIAYAYVKTAMGERVLSPGVIFKTLGFEAFPTSLTFPTEGDTKIVSLSYLEEDITDWDITSKPSWCIITKDKDRMFSVKVEESSETRSGIIVVTGHSIALGTVTQNIAVTQLGINGWDGTHWLFSGTITTIYTNGSSTSNELNDYLVVNSISNNDIYHGFALTLSSMAGYNANYAIDGNGNLLYNATAITAHLIHTCKITFVRTGPTTANEVIHYQCSEEDDGFTMSGVLQGTLVDANEIRGYESSINFKTPAFDNKALKNK